MNKMLSLIFIYLVILPLQTYAQAPQADGLLIKLKGAPSGFKSHSFLAQNKGKFKLQATYGKLGMHHIKLAQGESLNQTIQELSKDPLVEYVEPNYLFSLPSPIQDDPMQALSLNEENYELFNYTYSQSGNQAVQLNEAWTQASTSVAQPIIVAVIDTGIDYQHPVFTSKNALWINPAESAGQAGSDDDGNGYTDDIYGWNFAENNANPMDSDHAEIRSHGTHVAGIILGVNQALQSAEQSRIKIMGLKFLAAGGTGSTSAAIQAIYYAVNNGAKVINMSWGGPSYSQALHDALAYAYHNGVILVAAAGNSAKDNDLGPMYPANFPIPSQLTVGAINDFDELASFSNFGLNRVQVTAPGVAIYSTSLNGFRIMSGTSMAAPFVAGLAAMILAERPDLTSYQVRNLLMNTADAIPDLLQKILSGNRVQALNAIVSAKNQMQMMSRLPDYQALKPADSRQPASEAQVLPAQQSGGCGMVSASHFPNWLQKMNQGGSHAGPLTLGLSLLPLLVWQILRRRAMKASGALLRRYPRVALDSNITINVGGREMVAHMKSLSAGGAAIEVETLLEKGGVVSLQIQSPDGTQMVEVQGEVVWSEANQSYGVQFANSQDEVANWFQKTVGGAASSG